jgi:hypothetical protein
MNAEAANPPTHLKWLFTPGQEAFHSPPEWQGELRRLGIRCAQCGGIRPDARDKLSVLVITNVPRSRVQGPGSFWGGMILRSDLIDLIGRPKVQKLCRFVPIEDERGKEVPDFWFLMEHKRRGQFRGSKDSMIGICKVCGRLGYWPQGAWYLLRCYWDGSDGITLLDDKILCTPEYFRDVIGPMHLRYLKGESRTFSDEPQDGLPADYDEMIAEIRVRGWVR